MTLTQTTPPQTGIVVSTAITAGIGVGFGERNQHAEGIVVSTAISAGIGVGFGERNQHAEGIVVSTAITAGLSDCPTGTCTDPNNHAEGLVLR